MSHMKGLILPSSLNILEREGEGEGGERGGEEEGRGEGGEREIL